jgi:hypothetical protein
VTAKTQTVVESRDFLVTCFEKVRSEINHCCHCRQCGERCSWRDDNCHVCGAQDPIRLSIKSLAYGAAILVALSLIINMRLS